MPQLYIGTSGWSYHHWKDDFYGGIPKKNWLKYYAEHFSSVEVNATFYRLQSPSTFKRWNQETPESFIFTIKANHYLTHSKKLLDPMRSVLIEKEHASFLKNKLAVVLWQLPHSLKKDLNRLKSFMQALESWKHVRHAVEFRNSTWFDDETADCLANFGTALCISDSPDWPAWIRVTTDLVYIRLHGHILTYASPYKTKELVQWADQIGQWLAENRQVHVYFDNDANCNAPRNALELKSLLSF